MLDPKKATNEGARRLRELLRKHSAGSLAKRLRCDEKSVRNWARGVKPSRVHRWRIHEVLGIVVEAWDSAPASDCYTGAEPATTRK